MQHCVRGWLTPMGRGCVTRDDRVPQDAAEEFNEDILAAYADSGIVLGHDIEYALNTITVGGHDNDEWDGDHLRAYADNPTIDTIARRCGLPHDITFVLTIDLYDYT